MNIEEITMEEFKKGLRRTRTLVIPFGTVEEHGKHLPLGTDTIIAVEVLRRVEERKEVFIAPPLHYGVCTSTKMHPGTITITPETLRRLAADIIRDAHLKGIRNFILVSGHGGGLHMNALKEVAEMLVDEHDVRIAVVSPYEILWKEIAGVAETENDSHAGEIETSLVLTLRPELVKGRSKEEYPKFPKPLVVRDKLKYWPGGVWGNPGKATPEKGERVIGIIVDKIVEIIEMVEK
ncbi:creatinine amidohydrolase [bacterium BMS3Bbin06]|nr:creatinine amidohydrolase [bacterium BMS3Abin08]GBE33706.1 creatinine amidohydrolase [bacterium BMS3Bbin06]HDO35042.1 creatininase family protein [Nitrospirota bacterium]HDY70377.1 creatininase family protein [Nitrospirota bacterium]